MNEYMLCCREGACSGVGLEILTERHVGSFVVLAIPKFAAHVPCPLYLQLFLPLLSLLLPRSKLCPCIPLHPQKI